MLSSLEKYKLESFRNWLNGSEKYMEMCSWSKKPQELYRDLDEKILQTLFVHGNLNPDMFFFYLYGTIPNPEREKVLKAIDSWVSFKDSVICFEENENVKNLNLINKFKTKLSHWTKLISKTNL